MTSVFVTGAGSGIGFETARQFALQGKRTIGAVRNAQSAEILEERFKTEGLEIETVHADLAKAEEVESMVQEILSRGPIDALINNAGVAAIGSVENSDDLTTTQLFEINVFSPLRLIRHVVPEMRARRAGTIVNISSMAGEMSQPFEGLYGATKRALEGLTEQLYYELKPFDIRVISIQPGRINTPIREKLLTNGRFDPDGPYSQGWDAWQRAYEMGDLGGEGAPPELVVETIMQALNTDKARLRWPVGDDAQLASQAIHSSTFEEFEVLLRTTLGWQG